MTTDFRPTKFLSTGNTVLNLALTGRRDEGIGEGHYVFFVGDSSSGKTWWSLQILAEACNDPRFDDYLIIFDNAENGAQMDVTRFFGKKLAARLRYPWYGTKGKDEGSNSRTVEELYRNLRALQDAGKPFIYLLDSENALTSEYAIAKAAEMDTQVSGGAKAKKDYGDGKAAAHSRNIRDIVQRLQETGSILVVLAQTRDNIEAGQFEEQKTRAGGHALTFYSSAEVWTSVGQKITKAYKGNDVQVGTYCNIKTKKNRNSGQVRFVRVPFYNDMGIDEVGGCIDFLTHWKRWKTDKEGVINCAPDFEFAARREAVAAFVEANDLQKELSELVQEVWNDIAEAIKTDRKPRYADR